ncbi:DegT/DnrJ/EryC1/StrS family aminotransferase [bacterium]|nr:DegT/DnrJ/EryC1/StrS family aminotransferase [bacterium]
MNWKVPLTDVTVGEEEIQAATNVLRSGWLTQGERVAAFESAFAEALGVRHAVAVTNGTAALHLAYAVAGLGPEDEFIVPALTFAATMNAGIYLGARPVLADCASEDDLTISVEDVVRKITPKTRVIVPMAYGGFCPDLARLRDLARDLGIVLIEDAAHAPLARLDGRAVGSFGLAGCFSFFGNKNMTTGEGGLIVTDDEAVAGRLGRLRSHGMSSVAWDRHAKHAAGYDISALGYNYRLDEMRAAVGLEQLKKLPEATRRRSDAAALLRVGIERLGIEGLSVPFTHPRGESVHHIFAILLPEGTDRFHFRRELAADGVQTSMHYPLLHRFAYSREIFARGGSEGLPVAESIENRLVTLPMGPHLDRDKIDLVVKSVGRVLSDA